MTPTHPRPRPTRAFALVAALAALLVARSTAAASDPEPLDIGAGERLLVIAPHPDDETIATAGLIQRVLERGGSARVVLVTAGDGYQDAVRRITPEVPPQPREYVEYGEHRIGEAEASARTLGGEHVDVEVLGFPDGALKALLDEHWPKDNPERSATTGAADPPYDEARAPALSYSGANLRGELTRILREARPTIVCLPDPIDIHPDHSAAGVFALLALDDWRSSASARTARRREPRLVSYLVHWPNWPGGWTEGNPTLGELGAQPIEVPNKLPERAATLASLALDDAEVATKRAALSRYASQLAISPGFLNAFVRRTELFFELGAPAVESVVARYPWAAPGHGGEATRHARDASPAREDIRAR